jgi:hypothetical protein
VKLFPKGKAAAGPAAQAPVFRPIDRTGLLSLLDQVVNGGQSGVLELHEPRGNWVYAFQGGALTHASGGRVRGARQAFDLLWEFQSGEFMFAPGPNPSLAGNLYIDKGRLLDLLRRSEAVLQGPSAPYIPPGQQRPIAPVSRPYSPPSPGQMPPQWQPAQQQPQVQGWPPAPQQGVPGQPGIPWQGAPQQPQMPGWPPAQQQPAPPGYGYPPAPPGQPYPPQAYPGYPQQAMPPQPMQPPQPIPQQPPAMMPPAAQPPFAIQPPVAPSRPVTPQSFSVPPMAIPKKREAVPTYQPQAAPPPLAPPAQAAPPKDDLAALRASLVAQAPQVRPAPSAPSWGVRQGDGSVAPATVPEAGGKGKGKGKGKAKAEKTKKGDSRAITGFKLQLIKFLLWACERRYSPDDHWTLKDAFEVSTMELRDQFIGAFAQTLKANSKPRSADDDMDDMTAGRMRGRGRRH